jgi:glucose-1-phosphate cytidylyltransferase
MKTVIFCGGLGTRLREETEYKPKPMVNIGDKPILWHIMNVYSAHGYNEFILPLGYKGSVIKEYFYNYEILNNDFTIDLNDSNIIKHNNKKLDWKISCIDTGEKTLKGARLKKIESYITDDIFMVTYGDGLANININELINFHKSHGKIATLTGVNIASRFGELKLDGDKVIEFNEKTNTPGYINIGYFVFNRKIFDYLNTNIDCDLECGTLESLAKSNELMVYKHHGEWVYMDTLRDVEYLNTLYNQNKAFWK